MTKTKCIQWAQANNKRFVFSQRDGFGKVIYFVTDEDRRSERQLSLVWSAE